MACRPPGDRSWDATHAARRVFQIPATMVDKSASEHSIRAWGPSAGRAAARARLRRSTDDCRWRARRGHASGMVATTCAAKPARISRRRRSRNSCRRRRRRSRPREPDCCRSPAHTRPAPAALKAFGDVSKAAGNEPIVDGTVRSGRFASISLSTSSLPECPSSPACTVPPWPTSPRSPPAPAGGSSASPVRCASGIEPVGAADAPPRHSPQQTSTERRARRFPSARCLPSARRHGTRYGWHPSRRSSCSN